MKPLNSTTNEAQTGDHCLAPIEVPTETQSEIARIGFHAGLRVGGVFGFLLGLAAGLLAAIYRNGSGKL